MEILWLAAFAWIAFSVFSAGALGYSLVCGEDISGFKSVIGLFFIVTWAIFFYIAVPAFVIGVVWGLLDKKVPTDTDASAML